MFAFDPTPVRELHQRVSDGIRVSLLWGTGSDDLWVAVVDDKTGEQFTVNVPERDRALDVFNHPYAYAAAQGVQFRPPMHYPRSTAVFRG